MPKADMARRETTQQAGSQRLPSVDQVLRTPTAALAIEQYGRSAVVDAVRAALASARKDRQVLPGDELAAAALALLEARAQPSLRPVFNLTGTVLHTNLGRALLAQAAIDAAVAAMQTAVALEFDIASGRRGERDDHVRTLLCELTGAEDATVVNNNAAAVLLALNTLAKGRETIVSRGELIEIGGAFRLPDIMARAGTTLREVGTTNRTHLRDFAAAIGPLTGLVLKVHTSNYAISGFTAVAPTSQLAELAHRHGVPLVEDLGSGTLIDLEEWGLPHEPTVAEALTAGADLVTFSGDKLLGGPQAGLVVGRADLIAVLAKNPLKRALRLDKIRLAALEAVLRLYADPDRLAWRLPTLRLLTRPAAEIEALATRLLPALSAALDGIAGVEIAACKSQIGSGALPVSLLPSAGLALRPVASSGKAVELLAQRLRELPIPVVGRIENGRVVLDLRCLEDEVAFAANFSSFPRKRG